MLTVFVLQMAVPLIRFVRPYLAGTLLIARDRWLAVNRFRTAIAERKK
jgi:hypothetical protein